MIPTNLDGPCGCGQCSSAIFHPLGNEKLAELDDVLSNDPNPLRFDVAWAKNHRDIAEEWVELLSRSGSSHPLPPEWGYSAARGPFQKYEKTMLRDFGLSIWWSHAHAPDGDWLGRLAIDGIYRTTVTYLVLPNEGLQWNFLLVAEPDDYDDNSNIANGSEWPHAAEVALPG